MPADTHALARLPGGHAVADGIDASDHLVTRHSRVDHAWKVPLLQVRIGVTDAAGLDGDAHLSPCRVGDGPLDEPEGGARLRDLDGSHRPRHAELPPAVVVRFDAGDPREERSMSARRAGLPQARACIDSCRPGGTGRPAAVGRQAVARGAGRAGRRSRRRSVSMKLPCAGLALTQWIVMVVALAAAPGRAQKGPPSRSFGPDTYRTGSFTGPVRLRRQAGRYRAPGDARHTHSRYGRSASADRA